MLRKSVDRKKIKTKHFFATFAMDLVFLDRKNDQNFILYRYEVITEVTVCI